MDNIIEKTKNLINVLEEQREVLNKGLLELIGKYNNSNNHYEKISLKKEIYKDDNYKEYMKYYNELFFYILKINRKFMKYISNKTCFR